MIDIVLIHPENIQFMEMYDLQRHADFSKVRIIPVNGDGTEPELYNRGLAQTEAEWVMLCDGNDAFASVYSLHTILNVLPIHGVDILWIESFREETHNVTGEFINCIKENFSQVAGKLYSREFLNLNRLEIPDINGLYEYAFNDIALSCTTPDRVRKINTQIIPFRISRRMTGIFSKDFIRDIVGSEIFIRNDLLKRRLYRSARSHAIRALYHTYIAMNTSTSDDTITPCMTPSLQIILNSLANELYNVSSVERDVIWNETQDNFISAMQNLWNTHGIECLLPEMSMREAEKWIAEKTDYTPVDDSVKTYAPGKFDRERIVVYCGTRNTYEHIITSIKSLLYHTPVDTIYVLAEDDSIGDVPNCVRVLNVSGQTFFSHDGPNYKNSWTYMCMMRAAFHKIFPQHSTVLSLDIDTVVCDDISDLFNHDIDNYYFAGVKETARTKTDGTYCNFGIILMNLDKLRDGTGDEIINALNTSRFDCPEQTAFNTFCSEHILLLPSDYNVTPYSHLTDPTDHERIIHYAGIKYWKGFQIVQKYSRMTWNEVMNHE